MMKHQHKLNLPSRSNNRPPNKKTDHNPQEEEEVLREELEEVIEEPEGPEVETEEAEEAREVEEAEKEEEEENSEVEEVEIEEAEEEEAEIEVVEEAEEETEVAEEAEVEDSKTVRDLNTFLRTTLLVMRESLKISKRRIPDVPMLTTSMSLEKDKTIPMIDTLELDTVRRTSEREELAKEDGETEDPKRKREKLHPEVLRKKKSRN